MNVIVFGATGKTGLHVCRTALDLGNKATAFTRSPHKVEGHPNLQVARGDVMDAALVTAAIEGHDAVIVALGSNGLRDRQTLSAGTKSVVEGMIRNAVERLVVLSAAGAGDSWGQVSPLSKLLFRTLLRNILADHETQEAIVRASSLDWTIVRAAVLKDDPASGRIVATNSGKVGHIGRADVAGFLVREANDKAYSRQAISITS